MALTKKIKRGIIALTASAAIAIGITVSIEDTINNNTAEHCDCIYPEPKNSNLNMFRDVSEWVDPNDLRRLRKLAKSDGATPIYIVFHHTVTSEGTTGKELCTITDNRFNLGCSYAISVHTNGVVLQLNNFQDHTPSVGGKNSIVISIAFVGNFQNKELPPIMLKRACQIRAALEQFDEQEEDFEIKAFTSHRHFKNTKCPGEKAYQQLCDHNIIDF